MPLLSDYAREKKVEFFFRELPKESRILEIGCGDGWLGRRLSQEGWLHYTGLDTSPPANIIGDIRDWKRLGIEEASFDIAVAFEVVEHVPCFHEMYNILRPGGLAFLTSPIPSRDRLCEFLERLGLAQKRTSPHVYLVRFEEIPLFEIVKIKHVGGLAQWGIFQKPLTGVTQRVLP